MINVGCAYTTKAGCRLPGERWSVIAKVKPGRRQYLAVCPGADGELRAEFFDSKGFDEWMECGGHWRELDLDTETPATIALIGLPRPVLQR